MTEFSPTLRTAIPIIDAEPPVTQERTVRGGRALKVFRALAGAALVAACGTSSSSTEAAPTAPAHGAQPNVATGSIITVTELEPPEDAKPAVLPKPAVVVTVMPKPRPGSTKTPRPYLSTVAKAQPGKAGETAEPAEVAVTVCPPVASASAEASGASLDPSVVPSAPASAAEQVPCYTGDITQELWGQLYPDTPAAPGAVVTPVPGLVVTSDRD